MDPRTSNPPSRSEAGRPAPGSGTPVRVVAMDGSGRPVQLAGLDALVTAARQDPALCFWLDLTAPDGATLERLADVLGLHPLVIEDIAEPNQRAKVERLEDGSVHIILFALRFEGEVLESEVDFILSERYLLTVHEADLDLWAAPLLRAGAERVLAQGPDAVLHAVADWFVDGYFPVLDRLTDEIDALQDDVVERPSPSSLERLFVLKRQLIALRRATSPAREIFNQLTNREVGPIAPEQVIYFRDVYDHLIRVTDEIDTYRELVAGTLEVYLSSVNNTLSAIMKRLTGVTVILAGIGAVAGLFGMSEAGAALSGSEATGFWLVVAATVAGAALVAFVLRRIDWI